MRLNLEQVNQSIERQNSGGFKDFRRIKNFSLSKREIGQIYDYRSCLLHGDFITAKTVLHKIMNKKFYKNEILKDDIFCDEEIDDIHYQGLIKDRALQIFIQVYKLYCENPNYVIQLKNKRNH